MAKYFFSLVPDSLDTKTHVQNDLFTIEIEPNVIFVVKLGSPPTDRNNETKGSYKIVAATAKPVLWRH